MSRSGSILDLLVRLKEEFKLFPVISHDLGVIAQIADGSL
jgi:ABC-type dipeptide/oligopeptide/nickel transport system ATPase component